jgi:hypothetical protein
MMKVYPEINKFFDDVIVKFKHKLDSEDLKPGLRLTAESKNKICLNFRNKIEQKRIHVKEAETISELASFGKMKGQKSYSSLVDHDDAAITCVNVSAFFDTVFYNELVEYYLDTLDESEQA